MMRWGRGASWSWRVVYTLTLNYAYSLTVKLHGSSKPNNGLDLCYVDFCCLLCLCGCPCWMCVCVDQSPYHNVVCPSRHSKATSRNAEIDSLHVRFMLYSATQHVMMGKTHSASGHAHRLTTRIEPNAVSCPPCFLPAQCSVEFETKDFSLVPSQTYYLPIRPIINIVVVVITIIIVRTINITITPSSSLWFCGQPPSNVWICILWINKFE